MKFLLCLTTLLTACPTPPKSANTNKSESAVQNNKGTQNNPNQQNSGGNEKGSPPENGKIGNPPPENGKIGNPPPENGEPSKDLPPKNLDGNQERIEDATLVKPAEGENDGDGSTIGVFFAEATIANNARQTQEQIKEVEHVTLSGKISCEGDKCDSDFILRLSPFIMPTDANNPLTKMAANSSATIGDGNPDLVIDANDSDIYIITEKTVKNNKAFTILAPKSDKKVILELLLDTDNDGKATNGESFVIYEGGGGIEVSKDQSDITFKFHPKTMNAPPAGLPN